MEPRFRGLRIDCIIHPSSPDSLHYTPLPQSAAFHFTPPGRALKRGARPRARVCFTVNHARLRIVLFVWTGSPWSMWICRIRHSSRQRNQMLPFHPNTVQIALG